jgi:N,N'-diacetyllegionaminate synthase
MRIGHRSIEHGAAYIIAEAGVNHNGDLGAAHALVDAAADSGADGVKFQTWLTDLICAPGATTADYQAESNGADQYAMLKRLELPFAWHEELRDHASDRGIDFLSTPDDRESARFLASLGVGALKVGSAELTNMLHLREIGALGLPVILSTGMASLDQVRRGVAAVRLAGAPDVAVLHCVSAYPAPEADMNLSAIRALRTELNVTVGLSDHTEGSLAAVVAVGVGIAILEKHITLDRTLPGPDQRASATPAEFAALCTAVRRAETMLGTGEKRVMDSERDTLRAVRRILMYTASLSAGTRLAREHLTGLRTGRPGIGVDQADQWIGRVLTRDVTGRSPVADGDAVI